MSDPLLVKVYAGEEDEDREYFKNSVIESTSKGELHNILHIVIVWRAINRRVLRVDIIKSHTIPQHTNVGQSNIIWLIMFHNYETLYRDTR